MKYVNMINGNFRLATPKKPAQNNEIKRVYSRCHLEVFVECKNLTNIIISIQWSRPHSSVRSSIRCIILRFVLPDSILRIRLWLSCHTFSSFSAPRIVAKRSRGRTATTRERKSILQLCLLDSGCARQRTQR